MALNVTLAARCRSGIAPHTWGAKLENSEFGVQGFGKFRVLEKFGVQSFGKFRVLEKSEFGVQSFGKFRVFELLEDEFPRISVSRKFLQHFLEEGDLEANGSRHDFVTWPPTAVLSFGPHHGFVKGYP